MFADKSASYETAVLGSLQLLPSEAIAEDLKRDYSAMSEMFMQEPPTFAELLEGIEALQKRLNAA